MKSSIKIDGKTIRLSLREEENFSMLNINGSNILHLNESATEYVKLIMEDLEEPQIIKKIRKIYKVDEDVARKDYEKVFFTIATLATRSDICPYSYLGVKNISLGDMELKAPLRVDLAITYLCNNKCEHCYMGGSQKRDELTTGKWKEVIDIVDSINVGSIIFTGGEPTLRKDLTELVDYNHDLVTGLVTNGRLLTRDLVHELEAAELDHIQITIEGSKETHNKMVGADAYDETLNGIKAALGSDMYILTNTTLTKQNYKEFPDLLDMLHGMGLRNFAVNSIIYSGKAENADYGLSVNDLKPILEDIKDLSVEYGMDMIWYTPTRRCELDPVELGLGLKCCSAARINVTVEPDGNVIPCQSWFESMGNILKDPWEDIWNSELAKSIRARKYMPEECSDCLMYENCTSGCPLDKNGKCTVL